MSKALFLLVFRWSNVKVPPEHDQNLMICSLVHYEHILKILLGSVNNFELFC